MNLVHEAVSQGRRAVVHLVSGGAIDASSPWSPEVPEELSSWLPDLFDRFPITLPFAQPKPVDPALHNVWILDNTAYRDKDQWKAEFVGCYFIKNSGKDVSHAVALIADHLDLSPDDMETRKRMAKRLQPFVDTVLPRHTLEVVIDGKETQKLGPSSQSGISSDLSPLGFQPPPTQTRLQTTAANLPPPFALESTTVLTEPTGWAIISDIDDTIKVTQTPSPIGILQNTFCVEHPEPVAGMPEAYEHMHSQLQQPPWFYLSASPYNLYPFLRDFRNANYPQGTIILRDASWQNLGGLIASLSQGTQEYKSNRIEKIHAWLPKKKFICIGDSTQSDPEAYGACARKFPGWIGAIFIRKVTGIAEMNEKDKNSSERFEKAFHGLDKSLWHVFTDPKEITDRVNLMVEPDQPDDNN